MREKRATSKEITWLRKKKIIRYNKKKKGYIAPQSEKKKKLSPSAIKRLYGFYKTKKRPKSTPFYEVYGEKKKLERHLERYPEKKISTPAGNITPRTYIRKIHRETRKKVDEEIRKKHPAVEIEYGRWYETPKHVRDEFYYHIEPPIRATILTEPKAKKRVETITNEIIDILNIIISKRKDLYKDHVVGALIYYKATNVVLNNQTENIVGYTRARWTNAFDLITFQDELLKAFGDALHVLHAPSSTDKTAVIFKKVLVYISTRQIAKTINIMRR